MNIKVEHAGKELRITHVSEDNQYVLATYESETKTKVFKLDFSQLDLSDDEKKLLINSNPKHQF